MKKLYADVKIFEDGKDQPLHHIRVDESYSYMEVEDDKVPVATHQFEFQVYTLEMQGGNNGL